MDPLASDTMDPLPFNTWQPCCSPPQDDSTEREVTIPVGFLLGRNGQVIRNTLHKLRLDEAVVNVPINLTNVATHKWKQPPWVVW